MLVAMTFNAAYFVAVVVGYTLAVLALSHVRAKYAHRLRAQVAAAQARESGDSSNKVSPLQICCAAVV